MGFDDWVFDDTDRQFMRLALQKAEEAGRGGEVPVGAVLVRDGAALACAGNLRESRHDVAGHAELIALRQAGRKLASWRLENTTLYVTLEPCVMCLEACRQARVELVIWGAADLHMGACGSAIDLAEDRRLGPPIAQRGGLFHEESARLLRQFFANRRVSS